MVGSFSQWHGVARCTSRQNSPIEAVTIVCNASLDFLPIEAALGLGVVTGATLTGRSSLSPDRAPAKQNHQLKRMVGAMLTTQLRANRIFFSRSMCARFASLHVLSAAVAKARVFSQLSIIMPSHLSSFVAVQAVVSV